MAQWIVYCVKDDTKLLLPFNEVDTMLISIMRLKACGYNVKVAIKPN
jgi:hypothetical protein